MDRGGRGKGDCRGGVGEGGGGRQEAKALLLQVSIPGLLAEGTASGGDGLLGASQEAALRREESEDTGRRRPSGLVVEPQLALHQDSSTVRWCLCEAPPTG